MNSATSSPRGIYTGNVLCTPRSGHRFYQCPICGGWVDSTNLKQMAEHEGEAPPALATQPEQPLAPPLAEAS